MLRGRKAAGLLFALIAPLAAGGLERTDLLPESMAPHIRVGSCAALKTALNRAALDDLRADKQFQDFSAAMARRIKTAQNDGKIPIGLNLLYDLIPQFQGEVVFALADDAPDLQGQGLYLAVAMDATEYAEAKERCAWLRLRADAPIQATIDTFQNHELIRFDDETKPDEGSTYWQSHGGNTLLLSHNREWVERSLVQLSKQPADEPEATGLHGYLPLGKWIRAALDAEADPDIKAARERLFKGLGLLELGDCTIELSGSGDALTLDINLDIADLTKGLFTLLELAPAEQPDDGLIPAHASSFAIGRINLPRFWKSLPIILADAGPQTTLQFQSMCQAFTEQTGADLGRDLIDHLGTSFCTYSVPRGTNQNFVATLELNDGRAFHSTLAGIFAQPGMQPYMPMLSVADFRGETLYSLFQNPGNDNAFTFCATPDALLLGGNAAVRDAILGLENGAQREPSRLEKESVLLTAPKAFLRGATDHKHTVALVTLTLSDHHFALNAGVKASNKDDSENNPLGENEISLNYIGSFLHDSYYYTEQTDRGIHHRIVLINQGNKE